MERKATSYRYYMLRFAAVAYQFLKGTGTGRWTRKFFNPESPCLHSCNFHVSSSNASRFGIIFDIDGVLVHSTSVISAARDAFQLLVNPETSKFVVPTMFCTNGFGLQDLKAANLQKLLNIEVSLIFHHQYVIILAIFLHSQFIY